MKYAVVTFGCRVNQADSLKVEEDLLRAGAVPSAPEDADVVVVNTCSVTGSADQGGRQTIRRIARQNPAAKIVVTGCYATRDPGQVRELPNVVAVVGNDGKPTLGHVARALWIGSTQTSAERFGDGEGSCGVRIEPGAAGRTAFTLRVQTGCAEACSYCIIPTTRGMPRSLAVDDVIVEVSRVAGAGFREIALTGVHLGSYGRDLTPASSLIELMRAIAAKWGGRRDPEVLFRISSLEPMDCTKDIVTLVATAGCFAPHVHLPLQHASTRMLLAMRRPYTIEYYRELVDEIRSRLPDASIGSDVIVGFPGETDHDFAQLASYLEQSPLTHVHVFPYSDRPDTVASMLCDKVPGAIVRRRAQQIRTIAAGLRARFEDRQVGTIHRGLTLEDGGMVVTDNYLKLKISAGRSRNEWVRIRIGSEHHGELLAG
jgi:threonylcarbamoyladenosine tRNA methylthiotransferase MtaB